MTVKPRVGTLVNVRTPRGTIKEGKFVAEHATLPSGTWWEIRPLEKGAETFRARPASVSLA